MCYPGLDPDQEKNKTVFLTFAIKDIITVTDKV